jgi:hypothetical protein
MDLWSWIFRRHRGTLPDPPPDSMTDLVDAIPADLRRALPEVAPAVLFTAWSLARHGHTARDLSRVLTLTDEQSSVITAYLRSPSDDDPHRTDSTDLPPKGAL